MSEQLPACLYIVATPIGNLADITERAIQVLNEVSVIAAEDTRHSGLLLQHYSIKKQMLSLHQHNEQQRSEALLTRLQQGESVALISDAGTPLISDPGYRLVSLIREHGIQVVPVPGSCAAIAALSASGLASDKFCFEGFLAAKKSSRIQQLEALNTESRTMIFYESPRRLIATLTDLISVFGEQRKACIARELTKLHETINTQSLADLLAWVESDPQQQKGESVLLVEGVEQTTTSDQAEIERVMSILIAEMPSKQAAKVGAQLLNINKNAAYDVALSLKK